jgi:hypothetical protein
MPEFSKPASGGRKFLRNVGTNYHKVQANQQTYHMHNTSPPAVTSAHTRYKAPNAGMIKKITRTLKEVAMA